MKQEYVTTLNVLMAANSLTNNANPIYGSKVEDAVYDFQFNNSQWVLSNKRPINRVSIQNKDSIIVVLESPHVEEFDSNGKGVMPLHRDSYFCNNFYRALSSSNAIGSSVSKKIQSINSCCVYLMNAIQLQCSLGFPPKYYRDYIFLYYWETMYKDFERRLQGLLNQNTIAIINLCTQGGHSNCNQFFNWKTQKMDYMGNKCGTRFFSRLGFNNPNKNTPKSLQSIIEASVKKVISQAQLSILYTTGAHPSSWGRKSMNSAIK